MPRFTVEQTAAMLGVTVEQIRAGHARNLPQLQAMLAKAEKTGRKVNGYTAEQLRERVAECAKRAASTNGDCIE